ncbi:MAG TPA: Ig-like domain-containing protein [Bacteroidales bacterium]|nr:Ig-like domain-containing protein [Bacteroidales bacterium]
MKNQSFISRGIFLLTILMSGCEKYGADMSVKDRLAPEITSVTPANNRTSIPLDSKMIVSFSEKINAASVTSETFYLKKGQSVVNGTITISDSAATFTPALKLEAGTVYTITITNHVSDLSGNNLPVTYTWSFTTAEAVDRTPPSVISVSPQSNATQAALNSIVILTMSEAISPASVTQSSLVVKKGTTVVAGIITVNGDEIKFTPSSSLELISVYTVTLTTAIRDIAGNTLASNYAWSFTTTNGVTGKSFSADVMPILNLCNTCHTHGWRPSATASTFHANLLNDGYISTTTPTDGKIYKKLSGSHPSGSTISSTQKSTVLTWITEGSKNN